MPKHTAASIILRQAVLLANPDVFDHDLASDVDEFLRYTDEPVLEHRSMPTQAPAGQAAKDVAAVHELLAALRASGFLVGEPISLAQSLYGLTSRLRGRKYRPELSGLAWT